MKRKTIKLMVLLMIALTITVSGIFCTGCAKSDTNNESQSSDIIMASESTNDKEGSSDTQTVENDEYFSIRDLSGEINTTEAVSIELRGDSILSSSDAIIIDNSKVTITQEGTYIISGSLDDGSIIVNADKDDKVQLVLDNVSINSNTYAPIYIKQADKVFINLAEGSTNKLTNGGSFIQTDDNNVDAVIYSKDDITLNGNGSLCIESPAGHGIVGKDEVTITAGDYEITAYESAVRANESIAIAGGTYVINAESDGFHAEDNNDDTTGKIYIKDGEFDITAGDDGIHATTTLQLDGGKYTINATEGLEATIITINDGELTIEASDDGINAAQKSTIATPMVEINGGNISINMGAGDTDGVDSNGDITINGGTVSVTGNSTFDYDGEGVINGGTVIVNGEEVTTLPNQMMGGHGGMKRPDAMGEEMDPEGQDGMRGIRPEGKEGWKGVRPDDQNGMRGPAPFEGQAEKGATGSNSNEKIEGGTSGIQEENVDAGTEGQA